MKRKAKNPIAKPNPQPATTSDAEYVPLDPNTSITVEQNDYIHGHLTNNPQPPGLHLNQFRRRSTPRRLPHSSAERSSRRRRPATPTASLLSRKIKPAMTARDSGCLTTQPEDQVDDDQARDFGNDVDEEKVKRGGGVEG
ncbi:hypothetical protein Drorol1_Dr00020701 [Drosera rotundifolia]